MRSASLRAPKAPKQKKPKRDPKLPTKAQQCLLDRLTREKSSIYIDRHSGDTYRVLGGGIVDGGIVRRCVAKGLLTVLQSDLTGAPMQWGVVR